LGKKGKFDVGLEQKTPDQEKNHRDSIPRKKKELKTECKKGGVRGKNISKIVRSL